MDRLMHNPAEISSSSSIGSYQADSIGHGETMVSKSQKSFSTKPYTGVSYDEVNAVESDYEHEVHEQEQEEYDSLICREFGQNLHFRDVENILREDEEKERHNFHDANPILHSSNTKDNDSQASAPSYACSYCEIHNPASVARCLTCNRWFCNWRGHSSASHLVTHLVRSKHKEIALHHQSPLGDTTLECYNCGCRNVFLLGFIPAKADSVVVLLCRQPCAAAIGVGSINSSSREVNWDLSQWHPLIDDKCFLPWLVKVPTDEEQSHAKQLTVAQINRIEETWRDRPTAKVEEIEAAAEVELEKVKIHYESAEEYVKIFHPLVACEADYDKKLTEAQKQQNVSIRWETGLNMRKVAWFSLTKIDVDVRIASGDEVLISHEGIGTASANGHGIVMGSRWSSSGNIIKVPPTLGEEIAVEIVRSDVPSDATYGYSVEFIWKATSYDRMHVALNDFLRDDSCITPYLRESILSRSIGENIDAKSVNDPLFSSVTIPRKISTPGLAELNHSQISAIREVLQRPLSLIQGPPGTGKTVTSATLIYHMVKLNMGPVLVCAPSNVAVDQLTEKIHSTGLKVVRLAAKSRESIATSVSFLNLHEQIKHSNIFPDLEKLIQLKEEMGEMSGKDEKKFKILRAKAERILIKAADVVCCTCVGAGDPRIAGFSFRTVLVDEATQACEPECLIPLTAGVQRAVLVGDHQQLGPVIMNKKATKAGFSQSMFERLVLSGLKPFRLQVQYRMHPSLSEFPSNMFYEGSLQNGVTCADRTTPSSLDFPWPNVQHPMFFCVNLGQEEISSSGTSYLNRTEAISCEKMVSKFLKGGVLPQSIGVITPYEGQRAYIINYMLMNGSLPKHLYEAIEVASVDAFQGREKDYIILSCVRSNDHQGIGFLNDPRRLNVALTRAKYGLVILGNPKVLSRHALWHHLLVHFRNNGLLVEGPLSNLRLSLVTFSRPRLFHQFPREGTSIGGKYPSFSDGLDENDSLLISSQNDNSRGNLLDFSSLSGIINSDSLTQDSLSIFDTFSQELSQSTSMTNINVDSSFLDSQSNCTSMPRPTATFDQSGRRGTGSKPIDQHDFFSITMADRINAPHKDGYSQQLDYKF